MIKYKFKLTRNFSIYIFLISTLLCATVHANTTEKGVNEVYEILISCPDCEMLGSTPKDKIAMLEITKSYRLINRYDTATIRKAMVQYVSECKRFFDKSGRSQTDPVYKNLSVYNLMILNRFIFSVPAFISKDEYMRTHEYIRMHSPIVDERINLLWPVTITTDNQPVFSEVFYCNMGPWPDPIGEFDVFLNEYGRRITPQIKN
jgi:hypothetical protein